MCDTTHNAESDPWATLLGDSSSSSGAPLSVFELAVHLETEAKAQIRTERAQAKEARRAPFEPRSHSLQRAGASKAGSAQIPAKISAPERFGFCRFCRDARDLNPAGFCKHCTVKLKGGRR